MQFNRLCIFAFFLYTALLSTARINGTPTSNQMQTTSKEKTGSIISLTSPNSSSPTGDLESFRLFRNHFSVKCSPVRSEGRGGCSRGWKIKNSTKACSLANYDSVFPCAASPLKFLNEVGAAKTVLCSNKKLKCLGDVELPGDAKRVFLNQNKLADAWQLKETLRHLQGLEVIDISSNDFKRIPDSLFEFNPALQKVKFERNFMVYIQESTFSHSLNLTEVFFGGNQIQALPWFLFAANSKLRVADFHHNSLVELPMDLFYDNPLLEIVDFSSNRLREIAVNSFLANPNLSEVGFSSNYLSEVPSLLFETNKKLIILRLSHNRIQNLSAVFLQKCRNLERLDLSFNQIHFVENGFLRNNIKLRYLDLRGNLLHESRLDLFQNFPGRIVLGDRNETRYDRRFFTPQRRWLPLLSAEKLKTIN